MCGGVFVCMDRPEVYQTRRRVQISRQAKKEKVDVVEMSHNEPQLPARLGSASAGAKADVTAGSRGPRPDNIHIKRARPVFRSHLRVPGPLNFSIPPPTTYSLP